MLKDQSNLARPQRNHELSIPIYSPRTTYNNILVNDEALLTDLTLNFDSFTINVIKSEIKARNGVLPLVDFFLILKDQLTNWQKDLPFREKKLMRVLTMLFDEIDLNGNGVLEWDEFTTYIIDKATVLDSMKSKNEEVKAYTPVRLKLSKKFESLLTKVIYLQDIDRIAFLEEGSDEIHFINHETGAFNPKPLKVTPVKEEEAVRNNNNKSKANTKGTLLKHAEKSMVLDMIYVREKKSYFLLTSSDDCAIRTWKYTSSGFLKANSEEEGAIYFTQAQVCIAWDEINQILYSGQRDGAINIWDRKSDTIIGKLHQDGHTDLIMDIIPLPKLQLLATCSLDKTIILWNTITNKKVRVFREHTRGVVSLAFNKSLILLISAGYDHQICVWNPYIDNAVFKITSHNFPLVGVRVIEGTNHFVSLDSSGNIKVWDFKKFNCIQTMSLETVEDKHKFHPQAFTFIPKPLKLVLAGRTLNFFEYDKNYNPNAADDSVAFSIRYRPSNNTIITPTGNKIKVWNALTGEIKKIFLDISDSEITTFTLDELKKRCLIGFSNGEAAVYNVINGAKIKVLAKHHSEVSHIIEAKDLGFIITASGMDGTIKIHTDKAITESELARVISIQEVALTAIVYQPLNRLLVTGTQNGIVAFWEAETGKFIGQCSCFGMEEIVSIAVLQDLDYVIVATSQGKIGIITSPPSLLRYNKVYEFINYDGEGLKIPVYPFHLVWSHEKKTLFIADDRSWVKAFDLSGKIEELYHHKEEERNRKLAQENSAKYTLTLPEVSTSSPPIIWSIKAHNDPIKGFEYAENVGLIFTSALDKKIKIWHSDSGKYIDALQQKYDGVEPIPIAFKKPGWEGIFSPNLADRIDKEYTSKSRREQLQKQAELRSMYQRSPATSITSMEKSKISPMKTLTSLKLDKVTSDPDSSPMGSPAKDKKEEQKNQGKHDTHTSSHFAVKPTDHETEPGSPENALLSAYAEGEAGKTVDEIEEEEFNPYFNWKKIDLEKLGTASQSLQWKLHIDFTKTKHVFDRRVDEAAAKIEKAEKNGVVGRLTTDQPTTTPNEEVEIKEISSKDKQAIIEQEAEAVRKMKELEKKKEKNIEAILGNQLKEGHIMKGAIQYQNDNKYSQVKSKILNNLHQRELKGKSLDKHKKVISLTAEEATAAKKLAEALSNYDKDDKRNVKFLEFQVKQQGKDKEHKDFINLNKQKLAASGTPSTNPNNSKDNTGR